MGLRPHTRLFTVSRATDESALPILGDFPTHDVARRLGEVYVAVLRLARCDSVGGALTRCFGLKAFVFLPDPCYVTCGDSPRLG